MRPACIVILAAAIAGCASHQGSAPVVDRTARGGAAPAAPVAPATPVPQVPEGHYLVKRGDTLYSIALEHGADYRDVAQWNNLDDPAKIRAGQVLRVKPDEVKPAGGTVVGRIETRPMESRPLETKPAESKPAAPAPASAPASVPAVVKDSGEFMWPARGKILAGFAEPRSKGIDIDGRPGDSVVAAAAGRVTYTGSGIPGLGQLVVIRHDNGFITVYAHNRRILVKEQQSVARGQKIAEIGSSDADRPKLHFQIRKGSAAVDPLRYLPAP
jgi:lipoprotein NlpD